LKINEYKTVIDIITADDIDYRAVSIEIAKDYPSIFIGAATKVKYDILKPVYEYMREGKFVSAIKEYRNITGTTLKDAKEYCDGFRHLLPKKDG